MGQLQCTWLPLAGAMRFGSTAKVLAECKLKYDRIPEWLVALSPGCKDLGLVALVFMYRHPHTMSVFARSSFPTLKVTALVLFCVLVPDVMRWVVEPTLDGERVHTFAATRGWPSQLPDG